MSSANDLRGDQTHRDARSKSVSRTQLGVENQSLVFSVFNEGEKLTVNDVYEKVRQHKEQNNERPLNERTIRRALNSLLKAGFLRDVGRQHNSILYGKQSASFADVDGEARLIPVAGNLVTVEAFFKTFADFQLNPLRVKVPTLTNKADQNIRRRMLFAVYCAQDPGFADELKVTSEMLNTYLAEVEHVAKVLKAFLDSPIWYEQYRDRIAYEIRQVQKRNPELYQLTHDAIAGG